MLGGLSALTLTRGSAQEDKEKEHRGRSSNKRKRRPSSFAASSKEKDAISVESSRTRSQSPFTLGRWRSRDHSPTPLPLEESDCESVISRRTPAVRPRTSFTDDPDSGSEYAGEDTEEEEWSDSMAGMYDTLTERNTEQNALIAGVAADGSLISEVDVDADADAWFDPDPHGEGVNVIMPLEPYFPSTLNRPVGNSLRSKRSGVKRKKSRPHELLPLSTSRPLFQRDRCTITITQGNPGVHSQRKKTYVVASDLSEESKYAIEWCIGTVLRDGDMMYVSKMLICPLLMLPSRLVVTVAENENKGLDYCYSCTASC